MKTEKLVGFGLRSLSCLSFLFLLLLFVSEFVLPKMFFGLPGASAAFDCDDAVKMAYDKLEVISFLEITPVLGSLGRTGEKYHESDHVWLLVGFAGRDILAIDWGKPKIPNGEYTEGYRITYGELLYFVEQDKGV